MISVTCDGCDQPIDRSDSAWFGVDHTAAPEVVEFDDGSEVKMLTELHVGDHQFQFHFCSAQCLSAWAFGRELD